MAVEIKKLQVRHGNEADLLPENLLPCELIMTDDSQKPGIKSSGGQLIWIVTLDPVTGKIKQMPTPADIGAWLIGEVKEIAYDTADTGWLLCQGQAISRTTYAVLFAKIGTKFGAGDGSTTFNLPPRNGKVGIGLNPSDSDFSTLGKTSGEKEVTLTIDTMPSHWHQEASRGLGGGNPGYAVAYNSGDLGGFIDTTNYTEPTGGGKAHNNMPPYVVMNYEIYTGVY